MINVYELKYQSDYSELKIEINNIILKQKVIIIKNGFKFFSLSNWEDFFAKELNFIIDKRQYDMNSNLAISKWWEVYYDPEKDSSYTYSKTGQPLHNDNAWFADPAEINFFCMKKQAVSGGEGTFYSLDRIMEDLNKEEPGLLQDLMDVRVTIKKGNGEFYNHTNILCDNVIFWNYYRIDKYDKNIKDMCDSFFNFLGHKKDSKSVETYLYDTNDAFCFNDQLLLHGRLPFLATNKRDRQLYQSMWKINHG
jgi:hypothetical protein